MKYFLSALLMIVCIGCGSDAADKMSSGTPREDWAELDALDEALRGVSMAAEMQQWKASQKEVDGDAVQSALDTFSGSTAPAGYDDAKKAAVVSAVSELIAAAKEDTAAYSKKFEALQAALKDIRAREE